MFASFFLGGFECASGYNQHSEWIDQIAATQHDRFASSDYVLLRKAGIRAARDGVDWAAVDRRGEYDFSGLRSRLAAARDAEVEVIWDLFHYGFPSDVDLFGPDMPRRFADYCFAAARYIGARTDGPCYFTPINEPSYFAWAAGEAALFAPHCTGRAYEVKVNLARAAIRGAEAIWSACPGASIVSVDPVCRVVPPRGMPDLWPEAEHFNQSIVFESWDMLAGRLHPELGGSREHLGIVGINYYWTNQWELTRVGVPLRHDDPRAWPMSELVRSVWERYGGDVLITETAHRDELRPEWILRVARESELLLDEGIPLRGVCLYPVLGMPEWHTRGEWARMGLWDLVQQGSDLARVPYEPALAALREAQRLEVRSATRPASTRGCADPAPGCASGRCSASNAR